MKKLILLKTAIAFIGLLFTQNVIAQNEKSGIKGKIVDDVKHAIPFANIAVYNSVDSKLVTGDASDINGKFEIHLPAGKYYLILSFLSYKQRTVNGIEVEDKKLNLGDLALEEDSKLLDEVEVTAERSQMELKLDKRVFNVAKDLSNSGSNAAEILDNLPSVEVDVEGNISLRASQNVRVLIDGKPSTITAGNVGEALRQFQGDMIERVEVITNPSSRYDAEGEVGIINIVLKKDKKKGINGSVEASAGYPDLYSGSFNLNFRQKKFNLFTSAGTSYRNTPAKNSSFRRFNSPDTSFTYNSDNKRVRKGLSNNFRLGSDWFINDKNTLTLSGFYQKSSQDNSSNLNYQDLDQFQEIFQEVNRKNKEDEKRNSFESALNYTKTFDKKDQKFTADLQWSEWNDQENSNIIEQNYRNNQTLLQETSNREANKNYLLQSDYVHPIGTEGRIETGVKATFRTINNDFQVKEQQPGASDFSIIDKFNNDFVYQENILAYYLMYGNKFKKFSYQIGLRTEHSEVNTELKKTNEKDGYKYIDFFPSAHFTYKLNEKNDVQLSYSRRVNRPHFRTLIPFSNFTDTRNFWRGNPDLLPEYTDSYEVGYLKYFEKGSLFSSVYYRHRNQVIQRITVTDSSGVTSRFPVNLATENNFGVEFNGSYNLAKKTSLNLNFNFYRSITEGEYKGENLDNDIYTWNSKLTFKTRLPYEIDMQISAFYRAPRKTSQGEVKAMTAGDISLAKDVLKGKGTLVASVKDVLNSRKYQSITETPYLYSESEFQWRPRQFLLTFTYRINSKKIRAIVPRNDGGGMDEGM